MADSRIYTPHSPDNWKPGDLAMATRTGVAIQAGQIYEVKDVIFVEKWRQDGKSGSGLVLAGVSHPDNPFNEVWYGHFIKVTPSKADKFDRETIRLMREKAAPAKVGLNGGAA